MAEFLLFALLVVAFLRLRTVQLPHRAAKLDRMLGDLSYSLYLNQYAVLVGFAALGIEFERTQLAWLLVVLAAVATAAAMQLLVERPLVALRDRVRGQQILEGDASLGAGAHHAPTASTPSRA